MILITGGDPINNGVNKYIFLLLKQHNITKKYYLCKRVTSNIKSVFSYKGSGKLWKRHLQKNGDNISTCILFITGDITEFKVKANFYNKIWNVGNNKNFLNLRPEEGDGGDTWAYSKNVSDRKSKLSKAMKAFNKTDKGKEIRKRVGRITSDIQKGKTMKERLGENYVDSREGKKWHEIYQDNYKHPQQKSFSISCNEQTWYFNNEREFKEKLNLQPDPILRTLKKYGVYTFKYMRKNSKHGFQKNTQLIFNWSES